MSTKSAFGKHAVTISAVAVAALLACASARAESMATASLGPFTITLYDLNPGDGIVPSITFNNPYGYGSYGGANAVDYFTGQSSNVGSFGSGPWAPISAGTSGVATAWANAGVSGSGSAEDATLSASGAALGTANTDPSVTVYSQFAGAAYGDISTGSFTLSAWTAVVVSAQSTLYAGVTHVWDPATSYGSEYAYADASLSLSGPGPGGGGGQSSYDGFSMSVGSAYYDTSPPCGSMTDGYCYGASSASDSRVLSVSFVNATSGSVDGTMQSYAQVTGYSYAPAVPEPASAALTLAGLVVLSFVLKSREKRTG